MKKLLRPQDTLLLFLAGGLDAFFDLKNEPMATACKNLYGWVPPRYQQSNYYQTVYHSLRTGYIEREIKDGEVFLRLTPKGNEKAKRFFPFCSWQKKTWDKKWRVVIFDIAELERKNRDQFRSKLREFGFGMLQESVWISPYDFLADLKEFIQTQGLEKNTYAFETEAVLLGNSQELAQKVWPLEEINEEYEELFSLLTKLHDRGKTSIEKIEGRERKLRDLRARYLEILSRDPCLPKELLPADWFRFKVERELKRRL